MVDLALQLLKESLDRFLINRFSLQESVVEINRVVDQYGKRPSDNNNKVVLCLINLSQETNGQYYNRPSFNSDGMSTNTQPAMHFNMELLCVADFDAYDESLQFLGAILGFFQSNSSISINEKDKDKKINSKNLLRLDIETESYFNTHNLWSSIGAKYQPSVIIKASHITIDENTIISRSASITSTEIAVHE